MKITKENYDLLRKVVDEMWSKYSDLVYYARNYRDSGCDLAARIEEKYPHETRDIRRRIPEAVFKELSQKQLRLLSEYDLNPHFEEGFNSGCFAAFGMVASTFDYADADESFESRLLSELEMFPCLDI